MSNPRMPCGGCGRFTPGDLYTTDDCRICWLAYHDPKYRAYYAGELPAAAVEPARVGAVGPAGRESLKRFPLAVRRQTPCRHRGEATGRQLECATCGGDKTTPEYGCATHGACTPGRMAYRSADGGPKAVAPWCLTCPDYEPPA